MKSPQTSRFATFSAFGALLVGLVIGIPSGAALAGSATSARGYYNNAYVNMYNTATVYTQSNLGRGGTFTANALSGNLPAGWLGAQGRLFKDGAANATKIGTWSYSPTASSGISGLSGDASGHFVWFSWGVSRIWNGNGYDSVYTFHSPNQNS
jgi:hypothetical protein